MIELKCWKKGIIRSPLKINNFFYNDINLRPYKQGYIL